MFYIKINNDNLFLALSICNYFQFWIQTNYNISQILEVNLTWKNSGFHVFHSLKTARQIAKKIKSITIENPLKQGILNYKIEYIKENE